jgi:hypothetical protein
MSCFAGLLAGRKKASKVGAGGGLDRLLISRLILTDFLFDDA